MGDPPGQSLPIHPLTQIFLCRPWGHFLPILSSPSSSYIGPHLVILIVSLTQIFVPTNTISRQPWTLQYLDISKNMYQPSTFKYLRCGICQKSHKWHLQRIFLGGRVKISRTNAKIYLICEICLIQASVLTKQLEWVCIWVDNCTKM